MSLWAGIDSFWSFSSPCSIKVVHLLCHSSCLVLIPENSNVFLNHSIISLEKRIQHFIMADGMDKFVAIKSSISTWIVILANNFCPCCCRHPFILEICFAAYFKKCLYDTVIFHYSFDKIDGRADRILTKAAIEHWQKYWHKWGGWISAHNANGHVLLRQPSEKGFIWLLMKWNIAIHIVSWHITLQVMIARCYFFLEFSMMMYGTMELPHVTQGSKFEQCQPFDISSTRA